MKKGLLVAVLTTIVISSFGQGIGKYLGDESFMYAETKQINQFFRRFNAEETLETVIGGLGDGEERACRVKAVDLDGLARRGGCV